MCRKLIAVDFDHVICDSKHGFRDGECDGDPMPGALENLWLMHTKGLEPFIFTTRADSEEHIRKVRDWFTQHAGASSPEVFREASHIFDVVDFFKRIDITNIKRPGIIAMIDDRAIRMTNWEDIRRYFC